MKKAIQRNRKSESKTQILSILQKHKSAMSHKEFLSFLEDSMDRVTIYRALDRLVEEGKIHKVVNLSGVLQYALCNECATNEHHQHHQHVHFSCQKCQKTICLETVKPKIELPEGFLVKEQQILISGVCNGCHSL